MVWMIGEKRRSQTGDEEMKTKIGRKRGKKEGSMSISDDYSKKSHIY